MTSAAEQPVGPFQVEPWRLRTTGFDPAGLAATESRQTVVNVTDGKLIRLHVGDSPFDLRYGRVRFHERVLDLRAGVLERRTDWTAPNGSSAG